MSYNRRSSDRMCYEAPVTYSENHRNGYSGAIMYNKSANGMGLIADSAIHSGLPICIIMQERTYCAEVPGAYKAYMAQVKWSKKDPDSDKFKIGVQLMFRGSMISGGKNIRAAGFCDLCRTTLFAEVYLTDDSLYLCLDCFKYLGGGSEDDSRESSINFNSYSVIPSVAEKLRTRDFNSLQPI